MAVLQGAQNGLVPGCPSDQLVLPGLFLSHSNNWAEQLMQVKVKHLFKAEGEKAQDCSRRKCSGEELCRVSVGDWEQAGGREEARLTARRTTAPHVLFPASDLSIDQACRIFCGRAGVGCRAVNGSLEPCSWSASAAAGHTQRPSCTAQAGSPASMGHWHCSGSDPCLWSPSVSSCPHPDLSVSVSLSLEPFTLLSVAPSSPQSSSQRSCPLQTLVPSHPYLLREALPL